MNGEARNIYWAYESAKGRIVSVAPRALIILLLKIIPNTASNTPIKSEKKKE